MILKLTVQGGEESGRTIEIVERATIGRAPDNTVVLADAQRGISRLQARIERGNDGYTLRDEGSNPTLLNDEALDGTGEAPLKDGDRIRIGAYTLLVSIEADPVVLPPVEQTLMKQPGRPTPPPAVDLPATPEFEAPPPAPLIPDDWNAPHAVDASQPKENESTFTPDPLAATPLLREPGAFGGDANRALMDALGSGEPSRDAFARETHKPTAPSRSFEHVSPERAVSAMLDALTASAGQGQESATAEPEQPQPRETAAPASDANLHAALLEGLGIEPTDVAHVPASELARLTGTLLREATHGTMAVLRSRATTRRETRVAMTMIEEHDNNPLKFFPDANRALTQMLGARGRGYLAPQDALRGAFHDIQAHELALMAGMRAAFDTAMARFDPAAIERSLNEPEGLAARFGNRRARLWQCFVKTWEQASRDAGEAIQQQFDEPFGRAYQAQLDALKSSKD